MKTKNLVKRAVGGIMVAEFIMQAFFLVLSISLGEVVYSTNPSEKGLLHDFITQFVTFAVLGLSFGIIGHIYIEKIKQILSGKAQFKFIIVIFLLSLLAIIVTFGARAIIEGTTSFASIVAKGGIVLITLGGLFGLAYLIASPIFDKIDKECVEQLNKKLKENK